MATLNLDGWGNGYAPEEFENNCNYCGEQCEDRFCNKECEMAYIADNTDRSDD